MEQSPRTLVGLPSEGEGHTFESCRVRHFGTELGHAKTRRFYAFSGDEHTQKHARKVPISLCTVTRPTAAIKRSAVCASPVLHDPSPNRHRKKEGTSKSRLRADPRRLVSECHRD